MVFFAVFNRNEVAAEIQQNLLVSALQNRLYPRHYNHLLLIYVDFKHTFLFLILSKIKGF